jgi:hypothetical protein
MTGTLHEDQYTFFIISHSILLRMRNVSGKCYRENRNTHFIFNNFFKKKNRAVYEIMWKKILYSRTNHRLQYNTAHAHCMLDN